MTNRQTENKQEQVYIPVHSPFEELLHKVPVKQESTFTELLEKPVIFEPPFQQRYVKVFCNRETGVWIIQDILGDGEYGEKVEIREGVVKNANMTYEVVDENGDTVYGCGGGKLRGIAEATVISTNTLNPPSGKRVSLKWEEEEVRFACKTTGRTIDYLDYLVLLPGCKSYGVITD